MREKLEPDLRQTIHLYSFQKRYSLVLINSRTNILISGEWIPWEREKDNSISYFDSFLLFTQEVPVKLHIFF